MATFKENLNKVLMNSKPAKQVAVVVTDGNSIGKSVTYSEDEIKNAGITRDYQNAKEQREIEAIRKERELARRVDKRIAENKKYNSK